MRNQPPNVRILTIREQKVVLDSDLAAVYGVPTRRLNEQFRRNRKRFPEDFAFRLTAEEFGVLTSQTATLDKADQAGNPSGRNLRPDPVIRSPCGRKLRPHPGETSGIAHGYSQNTALSKPQTYCGAIAPLP